MDRYQFETKLWAEGYKRVMGLDEVGRGCLCGPVVAAGVILEPSSKLSEDVADSKSIDEPTRVRLVEEIKAKALFWTVQQCSAREIDEINILKASIRAMIRCSEVEEANPDYLLVDGNRFTSSVIPHSCIIKGDDKSVSIAAASILAKVHRDQLMRKLHDEYPCFGWKTNVGYPTKEHFEGLKNHGYTRHHRRSFKLRTEKIYQESKS
ncbi:MAG: ribonuclease HII [Balneolaceae bacterium]|nr:ribonuclease HII [Balneolaceae bacterium]